VSRVQHRGPVGEGGSGGTRRARWRRRVLGQREAMAGQGGCAEVPRPRPEGDDGRKEAGKRRRREMASVGGSAKMSSEGE